MDGKIKKIKGIFPVTTSKAVFMDGTSTTLDEFLSGMSGGVDPTPVSNPRTNCVLTVAGEGKGGFIMAGVQLRNPTLATTLELDIDVEILEGTTTYVQPWVYGSNNQLTQMTSKAYSSGKINYTYSQTVDSFGTEYLNLCFKNPDTVKKYRITFNSTGVFQIVKTFKHAAYCGGLDTLLLTYEQEYSSLRLLSRWSGKRYLAIGDSLTDKGVNTPDYPSLLKDIMGFSEVNNMGASGQTMSTGNSANSLVLRKRNYSYDYDLITIMLGVNDAYNAPADVGDVNATEYDTTTFAGAYRDVLDHIIANNPKAMIVLIQPIYCGGQNNANSFGKRLEDYREAVRQIADIYNLPTVNLRTGFNAKNATVFMKGDRLHLNSEGQCRVADVLGQFLCTV